MRVLLTDNAGDFIGETVQHSGDAIAVPTGVHPMPYDDAPQPLQDAADADTLPGLPA